MATKDPLQQEDDFRPSLLYYKASPRCCNIAHSISLPQAAVPHVLSPLLFFGFSAGYVRYRLPKDVTPRTGTFNRVWIICGAGSLSGNTVCS